MTIDAVPGSEPKRAARLRARVAELEKGLEEEAARRASTARERARTRAEGVDRLIARVIEECIADSASTAQGTLPSTGGPDSDPAGVPVEFAVVAVGGYGRAELSPRSDVDLVFLLDGKDSRRATPERALVERVLYALWDSGLEIGHSVRTVSECVQVGKSEVTARSSLLDHRYVAGDRDLYASFASTLERRLFRTVPAAFVGAKLLEITRRRERFGTAVSRNEPNLKEGEGGLRDAHTALWISRAVWGIGDAPGLVARGMAREGDVAEFEAGFERLLAIREVLHQVAGRKEDRLSFERQEEVARRLGYQDGPRGSATEQFMQALTQGMAAVQRFLQLIVDRMPDRFHKQADKMGAAGLTHRPRPGESRRAPRGFRVRRGRLAFADPSRAARSPVELIRAFAASAQRDLPLHPEARDLVRRERDRILEVRGQAPAVEAFFELLLHHDGEAVERAMMEMNDLGVLGAFLPEFSALYYRVQHDSYHVYTSDAHLIIAAANVHRLRGGAWADAEPLLTRIADEIPLRTFVLGVFLHDIGKSEPSHTEVGLRMLPGIAARLRMTAAEQDDVRFMIEHHLLMSHVAQRRDLADPQTIADFTRAMGRVERLKLLYALTFCDIKAVGGAAWTAWKGALLRELYLKAEMALTEGERAVAEEVSRLAEDTRAQAIERLHEHPRGSALEVEFRNFIRLLPQRYFAQTDPEGVADDFLLARLPARSGLKVQARVLAERRTTEITFHAPDRPGLFADLTGALSAAGLSIRTARIHTTTDGMAIDRFEVVGADGGAVDLLAVDRMVRDLLWVMTGKQTAAELLSRRKPSVYAATRVPEKPPEVEIHNDASANATVIDVYAHDRLGLLHDVAAVFTRLGLDVEVAIVSTKVDQVADSFYVRELGGGKLTDSSKLETLRSELAKTLA